MPARGPDFSEDVLRLPVLGLCGRPRGLRVRNHFVGGFSRLLGRRALPAFADCPLVEFGSQSVCTFAFLQFSQTLRYNFCDCVCPLKLFSYLVTYRCVRARTHNSRSA